MAYKTDIEIAQECELRPIQEIAAKAGIDEKYLEQYGRYKAKVDPILLKETENKKGKLVPIDENAWADADEQPTHAILMITSTSQGAYCGNLGNVLWVDNVRLEYPE